MAAKKPISNYNGQLKEMQTGDTVPLTNGGTGQTTASDALNALLPTQTGNSGKVLGTNGTTASWLISTPRTQTVTSSATVTPNADADDIVIITAQAAGLTLAAPTGTPVQGQVLMLRIKDNGTSRAITWNAIYRAFGAALTTATTISKTLYVCCIYNSTDTKWDVLPANLQQ